MEFFRLPSAFLNAYVPMLDKCICLATIAAKWVYIDIQKGHPGNEFQFLVFNFIELNWIYS